MKKIQRVCEKIKRIDTSSVEVISPETPHHKSEATCLNLVENFEIN